MTNKIMTLVNEEMAKLVEEMERNDNDWAETLGKINDFDNMTDEEFYSNKENEKEYDELNKMTHVYSKVNREIQEAIKRLEAIANATEMYKSFE